ncbi:hypothetical protein BaRGS_00031198 [Batillaria attramentaria]|uniref:CST complex subunit TEN1 n=1 Tax=Batillaria attramentaria TaxID=370345 RepID=A0ABD0JRQ4_9CAEN
MEARNLPAFGEQVLVHELQICSDWVGRSISVTGRLDEHDVETCQATLVDPKTQKQLQVDTSLVEPFPAKVGSLFQLIGEVMDNRDKDGAGLVLQARVVRCVDGLDLVMYERALSSQREFMRNRVQR